MKKYDENRTAIVIYRTLFWGMILGVLCYLFDMLYFDSEFFSSGMENYSVSAVTNLPFEQLIFYVLKCRCNQLLLIILGSILISYGFAVGIYSIIVGLFYGMAMCNLLILYGIKGIGYGILCFFPHYCFYFLAIIFWGKWFGCSTEYETMNSGKVKKLQYLFKIFVIISFVLFSLLWEVKFQKNILKNFYQYLV